MALRSLALGSLSLALVRSPPPSFHLLLVTTTTTTTTKKLKQSETSSSLWINLPIAAIALLAARNSVRAAAVAAAAAAAGANSAAGSVPRFGLGSGTSGQQRQSRAGAAAAAVAFAASAAASAILPLPSYSSTSSAGDPSAPPTSTTPISAWPPPATAPTTAPSPLAADAADARWREAVGSPQVVAAWEVLSGAVVQEFIYDSWWSSLSPDVDFPAAVRGALNAAFGEVARAARGLDVRRLLLGEGAELLMEHLQLFRDARESAVASLEGGMREWKSLPEAAREDLLKVELAAGGNLHPALLPPRNASGSEASTSSSSSSSTSQSHHPALLAASRDWPGRFVGHYAVLRRVAEGVTASVLDRSDFNHPLLRSVVRELQASAVLRPVVWTFAPHSVRRHALLAILRGGGSVAAVAAAGGSGSGSGPAIPSSSSGSNLSAGATSTPFITEANAPPGLFPPRVPLQGLWDFEQRLRASITAEESARRGAGAGASADKRLEAFSSPVRGGGFAGPYSSPQAPLTVPRVGGGGGGGGGGGRGGGGGGGGEARGLSRSASDQALLSRKGASAATAASQHAAAAALAATAAAAAAAAAAVSSSADEGGPGGPGGQRGSRSVPPSPDRPRLSAPLFPPPPPSSSSVPGASPPGLAPVSVVAPPSASPLKRGAPPGRDMLSPLPGEKGLGGMGNGRNGNGNGKGNSNASLGSGFRGVRSRHRRAASTSAVDGGSSAAASRLQLAAAAAEAEAAAAEAEAARRRAAAAAAEEQRNNSNTNSNASDSLYSTAYPYGDSLLAGADADDSASDAASMRSLDSSATGGGASAGLPSPGIDTRGGGGGQGNNLSATLSLQQFPPGGGAAADPSSSLLGESSSNHHLTGPAGEAYFGFLGRPRAKVVAADVDTSGPKDVVLFLVRVADGRGEWAVTRRHRHFEALHRALKEVAGGSGGGLGGGSGGGGGGGGGGGVYRLRLPNRRAFGATQTPEAVEERRRQLDAYLWRVLAEPSLCQRKEVWDFLSAWGAPPPLAPGFLKQAAASIRGAPAAARRVTVGAAVAVAGVANAAVDLTVGAAVGAVGDAVAAASAARRERERERENGGGGGEERRGAGHRRTPSRGFIRPPPLDLAGGSSAPVSSNASTPSRLGRNAQPAASSAPHQQQRGGEGSGSGSGREAVVGVAGALPPLENNNNDNSNNNLDLSERPTPRQSQATTPDVTPASGRSACDSPREAAPGLQAGVAAPVASAAATTAAAAAGSKGATTTANIVRASSSSEVAAAAAASVAAASPPPPGSRAPAGTPADSAAATPARSLGGNRVAPLPPSAGGGSVVSGALPVPAAKSNLAHSSDGANSVGSANADGDDGGRGGATAAAAAAALRSSSRFAAENGTARAPPVLTIETRNNNKGDGDDVNAASLSASRRNSFGRSASSPALAETPRARQRGDSSDTDFDDDERRRRNGEDDEDDTGDDLFEDAAIPLAAARAAATSAASTSTSSMPRPGSASALARGFASVIAGAVSGGGSKSKGGGGKGESGESEEEEDGEGKADTASSPPDTGHISFAGVALPRADDLTTVTGRDGEGRDEIGGGAGGFAPLAATTSNAANSFAAALGGLIGVGGGNDASSSATSAADWEEVAGASAPLYELVGAVFELHRRGFFRRQVFGVARQVLSLVAGGAIDDWMLRKLRTLRKPGTLAAALLRLQASLWPGGVWFARAPAAAAAAAEAAGGPPRPPPPQLGADGRPRWKPVTEASFMVPSDAALAGSEEIAAALRSALLDGTGSGSGGGGNGGGGGGGGGVGSGSSSTATNPGLQLVGRLVGKDAYRSGVSDVLDMISSPTLMLSLGHAVLKVVVVSLFPRLKPLYADIEGGGGGGGGVK